MTLAVETDKLANAKEQGQACFDNIREMWEAYLAVDENDDRQSSDAYQAILDDPLSVEVRGGWYVPGTLDPADCPAEYRILLCTGGPAVQIVGTLSEHGEPETAVMQVQDWFTPWTDFRPVVEGWTSSQVQDALLAYARCFYFGE